MKSNTYKLMFFLLLVILVCGYRYYDYVLKQNYTVIVNTLCDTNKSNCFISDCDPEVVGCEAKPYKKVEVQAFNAPKCLLEHTCVDFFCDTTQGQCSVTYCNNDNIEDGESCSTMSNISQ